MARNQRQALLVRAVAEGSEHGCAELSVSVLAWWKISVTEQMQLPCEQRDMANPLAYASEDDRSMLVAIRAMKVTVQACVLVMPDSQLSRLHCSLAHACI